MIDITKKIDYILSEANFPDGETLNIKDIKPVDLPRAETIGGMNYVMKEFTAQKVSPMPGNRWKLSIKNGILHVIWTPKGKSMLKTRMEKNKTYYEDVVKVFTSAYKKYSKKVI